MSAKAAESQSHRVEAEDSVLSESLTRLNNGVAELSKRQTAMAPHQVVEYIDDQLAEPFADFADARNALVQRFGLQGFADVMTQFASGERFVNRAWSAAADGYMEEVAASLERAQGHLNKAQELKTLLEKED